MRIRKKQQFSKDRFAAMQRAFPALAPAFAIIPNSSPWRRELFDIVIIDEASQVSIARKPSFLRAQNLVSSVHSRSHAPALRSRPKKLAILVFHRAFGPGVNEGTVCSFR
jgi:hypothetical protein